MEPPAKKILVVDDDFDIRYIISMILQDEGFQVNELDSGRDVVRTVQATHPDVILLDVLLGDMDGRDICKQLKNDPATSDIPIIIVSATHGWHTLHEKNCQANDFLNKPFDIADLLSQVRRYAA